MYGFFSCVSGPNDITVFKDDSDLADLQTKLVARYSAKVKYFLIGVLHFFFY